MIENKLFTAFPAGENASHLLREYRALMISNLVGYLKAIQSSLVIDISFIISKYEQIDVSKNFSPAIFNLFSKLSVACTKGEIPLIIDVLHKLKLLNLGNILNSEFELTTILTEDWELDFVNKIRIEHIPGKSGDATVILPIINPDLSAYAKIIADLKVKTKRVDNEFYLEIENYVTRIKLFNGKALKAATSASVFGAIYMNLPPKNESIEVYFAEHIIHETSHLHLDILLAFDKMLLNDEREKFNAPIRIDPRPMFGIFHATFVLSRMVRLFQRIMKDTNNKEYKKRLDVFRRQFDNGLETIEKYAILTKNGQRIKKSFIEAAEI